MKEGEGIKNSSKAYLSKDTCNNKTVVYAGVGGCHTLSEWDSEGVWKTYHLCLLFSLGVLSTVMSLPRDCSKFSCAVPTGQGTCPGQCLLRPLTPNRQWGISASGSYCHTPAPFTIACPTCLSLNRASSPLLYTSIRIKLSICCSRHTTFNVHVPRVLSLPTCKIFFVLFRAIWI